MSDTSAVSGTSAAQSAAIASATSKASNLGKDDFLKLLVTQLRFQDPMQPMEDKEFISQMAQFNSLEEMQNLNKNLTAQNEFAQLSQASSLIGKTVAIKTDSEHFAGKITEVRRVDSVLKVMVQPLDGSTPAQPYDLNTIDQVTT
ncbi:MAG TPA: flagellar hook capping FlgD N-terminal domain-containing protein [Stenomitos sp.]